MAIDPVSVDLFNYNIIIKNRNAKYYIKKVCIDLILYYNLYIYYNNMGIL